ncbi:MAG: efflux RND transporter periplasmic adaptor subunit [Vicinamibacterales bacterium]
MNRRTLTAAVGLVALVGVGLAVWARRGPSGPEVDVSAATRRATFRSTVTASGEIVATRYADIGSSVMGKIVSLPVTEGERVKAGQLLARIDPVQAESELRSAAEQARALAAEEQAAAEALRAAEAELAAAEARTRDADQRLERARTLAADGLTPASDLDSARANADASRAQVRAAEAAVEQARRTVAASGRRVAQARALQTRADDVVAKTSILAPIDGVVTRLRVREGEMVVVGLQNQPGTTLMTVSDLGAIDAEVKVAEADVLRLRIGQPAEVTLEALPGRRFAGTVVEIGASALPVTGTGAAAREFKVVVRLASPDPGLRPGLTCDAEIVTAERTNVLTVPLQAVVLRQDAQGAERTGVFLVENGVARFTPVTSGAIGGLDVEVEGLTEGAPVITGPYQVLRDLQDGAVVRPQGEKG